MRNQATPAKLSRKDCAMLAKNNLKLELENMKLKLDVERRVVDFMGQMQDLFAIVDSFFTEDDVRTLAEAKRKWEKFRSVLEETQNIDAALDAIDRVSVADNEANAEILVRLWSRKDEVI